MRVLFDQGTPVPLRQALLVEHDVHTVYERGWSQLQNGELLEAAERDQFQVLVSTDQNLKHQQSLDARAIGIVVLLTTSWPRIRRDLEAAVSAVNGARPGSYIEVAFES